MAAPRVLIVDLPEQTAPTDTDLLVVQNGATTKKMTVGRLTTQNINALNTHITDPSAAHAATAVSAVPSGGVMSGSDVQAQLAQAATAIGTLTTTKADAAAVVPTTRTLTTTAPLTGGGDLSVNRTLDISVFNLTTKGAVPPPTTATGRYLKDDGSWSEPLASQVRRPVNVTTAATYAPVLADENTMVSFNGATGVTVTVPSNATVPFAIGAEIDFLWQSINGQGTFVAGSGATLNGTPGLKISARFGKVTLKKIAASNWVVYGNLMA